MSRLNYTAEPCRQPIRARDGLLIVAVWGLITSPSLMSLFSSWSNTELGFSHGWPLLGVTLYTFWQKREQLVNQYWSLNALSLSAASAAMLLGGLWSLAYALNIQSAHQALALALLGLTVASFIGVSQFLRLLAPGLILIWALPLWTVTTPTLQWLAIKATGVLLSMSSIPATIDGINVAIPAGNFEIAHGCAGLRYLLVSCALATVYSLFYYRHWLPSLALTLVAALLAIAFNWLRIFAIILAGYLTEMKHPWVYDHETFGWYLFVGVLVPLFWIARRWELLPQNRLTQNRLAQNQLPQNKLTQNRSATHTHHRQVSAPLVSASSASATLLVEPRSATCLKPILLRLFLCCCLPAFTLIWHQWFVATHPLPTVAFPATIEHLKRTNGSPIWQPHYQGYSHHMTALYRNQQGKRLSLHWLHYERQAQHQELINSTHTVETTLWHALDWPRETLGPKPEGHAFFLLQHKRTGQMRLVLRNHFVAGHLAIGRVEATLRQLTGLMAKRADADLLAVSTVCVAQCTDQDLNLLIRAMNALSTARFGPKPD